MGGALTPKEHCTKTPASSPKVHQQLDASSYKRKKGICTTSMQGTPAGNLASCQASTRRTLVASLGSLCRRKLLVNSTNATQNSNEFALLSAWHPIPLAWHAQSTCRSRTRTCTAALHVTNEGKLQQEQPAIMPGCSPANNPIANPWVCTECPHRAPHAIPT